MSIPLQRPFLGDEELLAVGSVFETRWLGMGARAAEFEERLKELLGAEHVIVVNNGTAALHLALAAVLGPGDEVIVPSFTYVATIQAIVTAGGVPVFAEIEQDTINLDPDDIGRRITSKTRAVLPVHFGGLACNMDALLEVIRDVGQKIWVVEDAAHAFGSSYNGRKVGTLGDLTCFSFDAIKNITCGEGGAVTALDADIAGRIRKKRVLGMDSSNGRTRIAEAGFRYHLSDINAAIGLVQLTRMNDFRIRKQHIVREYDEAFADLQARNLVKLVRHNSETFPFFYTIRITNGKRDEFRSFLEARGISTGVHYYPNHLHPFFGSRAALTTTELIYRQLVTLPLHYEMSDADVGRVISVAYEFFRDNR